MWRRYRSQQFKVAEEEKLFIPLIKLGWSEWAAWEDVSKDVRKGGISPPDEPGVYEVKYREDDERLLIGRASNLRMRVKQGLVRGKLPYGPAREKILKNEDISRIVIRWAVTYRPATVEEELLLRHIYKFGEPPKYNIHLPPEPPSPPLSPVLDELHRGVLELKEQGLSEDICRNLLEAIFECEEGHYLASAMIASRPITYMVEQIEGKGIEEKMKTLVQLGLIPPRRQDIQKEIITAAKRARDMLAHRVDEYAGPAKALRLLSAAIELAEIYIKWTKIKHTR